MQEDSSKGSTQPACDRIDPIVAEALCWIIRLCIDKVLENSLHNSDCWVVASTTNIASNSDTGEHGKSDA